MSSVVVLTPNARRQTVKVTPNTTLLKVLEEACKKHGFNPEDYDIKHYNKVMDLTIPIRFSGLPNNAMLEMVPVKKRRQEAHVTVALQLEESLQRFTESFMPSDSLWAVIEKACPEEIRNTPKVPVIVYMHREIVGIESLSKTLLKDLGLTSGRAVLRLAFRDSEATPELKAIGSGLYIHPQLPAAEPEPVQTGKEENQNIYKQLEVQDQSQKSDKNTTVPAKLESADTVTGQQNKDETAVNTDRISMIGETPYAECSEQTVKEEVQTVKKDAEDSKHSVVDKHYVLQQNNSSNSDHAQQSVSVSDDGARTSGETELNEKRSSEDMEIENIEYIGERNALIFNPANEGSTTDHNLPDDFFNITVDDVRYLLRDLRRLREDVENQPLTINATKELNTSTRTLSLLHSYRQTVIRVQFPDRLVLQAVFSPLDTVETVMEFVKQFLEQPDMPFYLYSTPPKRVLEREQRLVEADCVPRALLYFGTSQSSQQQQQQSAYLKSSLLSSVTTQKQASAAALQVRRLNRSESTDKADILSPTLNISNSEESKQDQDQQKSDDNNLHNEPGPSGIQRNSNGQTVNKMPKWFKPV